MMNQGRLWPLKRSLNQKGPMRKLFTLFLFLLLVNVGYSQISGSDIIFSNSSTNAVSEYGLQWVGKVEATDNSVAVLNFTPVPTNGHTLVIHHAVASTTNTDDRLVMRWNTSGAMGNVNSAGFFFSVGSGSGANNVTTGGFDLGYIPGLSKGYSTGVSRTSKYGVAESIHVSLSSSAYNNAGGGGATISYTRHYNSAIVGTNLYFVTLSGSNFVAGSEINIYILK